MNRILRSLRCHLSMLVAVTLLMAGFGPAWGADASTQTEKHTRKLEKKVAKYRTGTLLKVDFRDNSEALGFLGDVSGATFQITNADSNKLQTFNYDDVTRVNKTREYIGAGSEPGHHFRLWVPVVVGTLVAGGVVTAMEVR
jgi:hypothetical protein